MLFFNTTINGLQLGLIFAVLALGLYISYSILDFPDLSVDGTFPLGGIICTILIYRAGFHPIFALFGSFIFGMLAGLITGFLHVKCKISKLLSGIIVMTGLLSITLALTMTISKTGFTTVIFSYVQNKVPTIFDTSEGRMSNGIAILVLVGIVIVCKILIDLFFKTKLGYMIKATGNNEILVTSIGKDPGTFKIIGISIANGFVGFSGALYTQFWHSYDNTSGTGKVVLALASVIIGIAVFSNIRFVKPTTAVVLGAIVYNLVLNYITIVDKDGIYNKLMNAVMFALIIIFNDKISSFFSRKTKGKNYKKVAYEMAEAGSPGKEGDIDG